MKSTHSIPAARVDLVLRIAAVLGLLYLFLVGIKGLGDGFKLLGRDTVDSFFAVTENPFVGLVVGILATTLVQSSSVITSMLVALVAAPENPLPLANAVPMIMGANIGTTVTNTVVSLAHMGRKDEFRRAFAVATCHDFFNFFTVVLLLPAEMATHFLRDTAKTLGALLGKADTGAVTYQSPLEVALKIGLAPNLEVALKIGLAPINALANLSFASSSTGQAVVTILLSGALVFIALLFIVRVMRSLMQTRVEGVLTRVLSSPAPVAMLVGAMVTVAVQSSSITTSLLVPLAGAGLLSLRNAFPITLGANVGTTITAMLASMAGTGANARAGLEIALVHLLFNLLGILLIYPIPQIRRLPLLAADWLAQTAVHSKRYAIGYVLFLFYGLPALLIWVVGLF